MPATLACIAHQRPVGQGGFYSATIQLHGREAYTFVYDCGSVTDSTRLSNEIAEFSRELGHRPLDLLVLSHLDADHVNGVDELLRSTHGVKDVFLPYLSPLERMIYVARYPQQVESYYSLLADPVEALRALGAENVYLVGDGEGGDDNDPFEPDDLSPDFPERLKDLPRLKLDTSRLLRDDKITDIQSVDTGSPTRKPASGVTDARSMTISGLWRLRMFQKQGLRAVLEKVGAAGNYASVPTHAESDDERRCRELLREVQKALGGKSITNQDILKALRTDSGRKSVRSAYKKVTSVHNEVSLCLWHGPAFHESRSVDFHAHATGVTAMAALLGAGWRGYGWRYRHWRKENSAGCILTGDIALKGLTLEKFKHHYARELPHTWLLQIPHHGSRHNIDFDGKLFGGSSYLGFTSAGLRNSYLHPHLDVIERLDDEFDYPVLWSHERRGVSFSIEVNTP